ncbi:MAG: DUF1579 family protein [Myxococcaceae bacterium]
MRIQGVVFAAAMAVASISAAQGQPAQPSRPQTGQAQPQTMQPPRPGEEVLAIAPVFGKSGTWTGRVPAGAMSPDSKEMVSHGKANCRKALDGLWYTCDVQNVYGTGANAMTYKGLFVVGYDLGEKGYRALSVDNYGVSSILTGTLEGKKLTLETPTEVIMMGEPTKQRLTFDFADPNNIKYTDQHQRAGGDWMVFEEAVIKPEAVTPRARRAPGAP